MPDPLRELSVFAEDAVGDIQSIVRDYMAAHRESLKTTAVGRFGGSDVGLGDRATQFAIANIVGIVEHYAEAVLLVAGSNPGKIKTWGEKPKAWKAAFGVDIEDAAASPSFTRMRGYYEARNAIMHRRGELTASQRNQSVYARLKAARIDRVGYHIVVNATTVTSCAAVCVQCVKELDATTPPSISG